MKALITTLGAAALLALLSSSASAALDDAKAQDLTKKSGCANCHAIDKKLIGPSYTSIAAKHKGQADAAATLEKSVRSGSKGVYGSMAMPAMAVTKISDADLHELIQWVLK